MKALAPAFIAGAVSALLYVVVFTFGLGFLFLFLPTLPIFWLGLGRHSPVALHACFLGAIALTVLANPISSMLVYLPFLALPAWYMSHEALKSGTKNHTVIWFPLTVIFARLMAAFTFALLLVTLYFMNDKGGLPALVAPKIATAFTLLSSELDGETTQTLQSAAPGLAFLVFAISAWMWAACLYLHAWIVNRELIRQKINIRPTMRIDTAPPPNWMISLILLTAAAALFGSPSLAFWGKTSLISLLFPYFLLGITLLHNLTRRMEYRYLLLFFTYFLLAMLLWPVFILAVYGLVYHIQLLNKYLSAGGTSSRS